MHDLRKQVLLESGKTVSRKARSKTGTPSSSRNGSRPASRAISRNGSDEEDAMSDATQWSTHSLEDLMVGDGSTAGDIDEPQDSWKADLQDRISEICDRKRSSVQGREESLANFNTYLTRHFALEDIKPRRGELLPAILKSVKAGQSEKETVLALRALALMLITEPSESMYDAVADPTRSVINDSEHPLAKATGIHVLSIATFYGGASVEETEATMDLLLEIASSDGASIEEADNADIVVAALEAWGFLATQLEDMEEITEAAMDTFVDQLESNNVGVQVAAGDNIALMYEKSFTEVESEDEVDEKDEENFDDTHGEVMVRRYTVYRQQHQLKLTLTELAKVSSKRLSKADKKKLHVTFSDILNTIEKPTRGPRYSTAEDPEGREYGSRLKISVPGGGKMTIDKWWKLHRLNALKRLLQGGFLTHYENNQVIFDTLEVLIEDD